MLANVGDVHEAATFFPVPMIRNVQEGMGNSEQSPTDESVRVHVAVKVLPVTVPAPDRTLITVQRLSG
jgi:hypothetical protein